MDYFDNISYTISNIFIMTFLYLFTSHRYSKRVTQLVCVSSIFFLSATDILKINIFPDSGICYTAVSILQIITIQSTGILISKRRNGKALFIGLSASNYTLMGGIFSPILLIATKSHTLVLLVKFAMHLAILVLLKKGLRDILIKQIENEYTTDWWELCLIPVFFYCSFTFIGIFPNSLYDNPHNILGTLCMMATMCVSYVVVLRYIESDSKRKDIYYKNALFETYIKGLENQYYLVEQSEQKLRILRHDMRHYANMILHLLNQGEYGEIGNIMSHISNVVDENKVKKYCCNMVVNTIVSEMMERAESFGIEAELDIVVSEGLPVNQYELAAVVANLFENAIICVKGYGQGRRYIKANIRCSSDRLFIQMKNECQEKPAFDSQTGLPKSSKGAGHGLGMRSIQAFSDKIGGAIDCFCENGMFCITLFAKF